MAGSFDRRRALQILVLAIGCVALAGLPRPGGPAHQRGLPYAARESAAVGAGATFPASMQGRGRSRPGRCRG